jgi:hypothetical protein
MLSCAMPFYHRVYTPGQRQFITAGTCRRTPLFLSDRFRRCWVQRLEEVRHKFQEKLDYMHNHPVTRGLVSCPDDGPWSSLRFYYLQDASILPRDRLR